MNPDSSAISNPVPGTNHIPPRLVLGQGFTVSPRWRPNQLFIEDWANAIRQIADEYKQRTGVQPNRIVYPVWATEAMQAAGTAILGGFQDPRPGRSSRKRRGQGWNPLRRPSGVNITFDAEKGIDQP